MYCTAGDTGGRRVSLMYLLDPASVDFPRPPLSLLDPEKRAMCEGFKLAYADFLLRWGLLGPRAEMLQYDFLDGNGTSGKAAMGDVPVFVKSKPGSEMEPAGIGKSTLIAR